MKMPAPQRIGERGFTLIETLVALALMGLVLSALANLTGQWLPNWNRGLNRIQRSEAIGIALQRVADDLAAAENVPVSRSDKQPLFSGSEQSVTFVRTAIGPNSGPGLDVVHLGETSDREGLATVRSRMKFHPLPPETTLADHLHFGEPVVLLRAPFRLSFAYAGEDHVWKSSWQDPEKLPARIRLTVRDTSIERAPSLSTVATVHVQSSAKGDCGQPSTPGQQQNAQPQNGQQPNGQQQSGQQLGGGCDDNTQSSSQSGPQQASGAGSAGQGGSR